MLYLDTIAFNSVLLTPNNMWHRLLYYNEREKLIYYIYSASLIFCAIALTLKRTILFQCNELYCFLFFKKRKKQSYILELGISVGAKFVTVISKSVILVVGYKTKYFTESRFTRN